MGSSTRGKGAVEAKGKEEKTFDYLQRRVPYLCERYGIRSVCEAQRVVHEVVRFYNEHREHEETGEVPLKRCGQALEAGKWRLRPLDPSIDLDLVFSLHYERTVKKDSSFSFRGREFKLRHCGGERVTVCLIPNEKLMVVKQGQKVDEFHL